LWHTTPSSFSFSLFFGCTRNKYDVGGEMSFFVPTSETMLETALGWSGARGELFITAFSARGWFGIVNVVVGVKLFRYILAVVKVIAVLKLASFCAVHAPTLPNTARFESLRR
jgi:hypothetical protein